MNLCLHSKLNSFHFDEFFLRFCFHRKFWFWALWCPLAAKFELLFKCVLYLSEESSWKQFHYQNEKKNRCVPLSHLMQNDVKCMRKLCSLRPWPWGASGTASPLKASTSAAPSVRDNDHWRPRLAKQNFSFSIEVMVLLFTLLLFQEVVTILILLEW